MLKIKQTEIITLLKPSLFQFAICSLLETYCNVIIPRWVVTVVLSIFQKQTCSCFQRKYQKFNDFNFYRQRGGGITHIQGNLHDFTLKDFLLLLSFSPFFCFVVRIVASSFVKKKLYTVFLVRSSKVWAFLMLLCAAVLLVMVLLQTLMQANCVLMYRLFNSTDKHYKNQPFL